MKIRTCFVSNSSSSSFIIALPNIKNRSKEEILEEWKGSYYCEHDKEVFEKIEAAINAGKNVIEVGVPYDSEDFLTRILEEIQGEIIYEGY